MESTEALQALRTQCTQHEQYRPQVPVDRIQPLLGMLRELGMSCWAEDEAA
jgi:hypothetical protein